MFNIYYVYILTNYKKKVLYIGVTNNLKRRLHEHQFEDGYTSSFTKRYYIFYLIYFEQFIDIRKAIDRETELKGWSRKKKEELIKKRNPNWDFLNKSI